MTYSKTNNRERDEVFKNQQQRESEVFKIQQERERDDLFKIQQEREREKAERARVRVVRDSLRAINCARAVFLKR